MKYCQKCGKELGDDVAFCTGCGASQKPAAAPTPAPTPASAPAPAPKKSNSGLVIGILIGVIVLLVGGFFVAWKVLGLFGDSSSKKEPETQVVQTVPETQPVTQAETTVAPVTEAETTAPSDPGEAYAGTWWAGDRYSVDIQKSGNQYAVSIHGSNSAFDGFDGKMTCTLNGTELNYSDGERTWYAYSRAAGKENEQATIGSYGETGRFYIVDNAETVTDPNVSVFTQNNSGTGKGLVWEKWESYDPTTDYFIWYSSQITLCDDDLFILDKNQLRFARNEIYARHGRIFKSEDLQSYFNSKRWYLGTVSADQFSDNMLSQVEKDNIKLIEAKENSSAEPSYQSLDGSTAPFDSKYNYGLSKISVNGNTLHLEGVINGSYQTVDLTITGATQFFFAGGEDPESATTRESFINCLMSQNGLGFNFQVNGYNEIVSATLCS